MKRIVDNLKSHESAKPSQWRSEAENRRENREWLRYSQRIAMMMLDRMEQLGLTQKLVSERMGCSQQYVSRVLKGSENLSIETIAKIEQALQIPILESLMMSHASQ